MVQPAAATMQVSRVAALALLLVLQLQLTSALAPNSGLDAPIWSWDDLINTDAPYKVAPHHGTLGTSYIQLSSMPVAGTSLGVSVIAPCAIRIPHSHPRANEHAQVLSGEVLAGWLFENNTYSNATILSGQYVVFPQGILHWQVNPTCETVILAISLSTQNPGTVTASFNLAHMPSGLQMQLFGTNITVAHENAVGFWPEDPACLARCLGPA